MSGGTFNYKQYHISEIADSIEGELNRQGRLKPKSDLWMQPEYYKEYPEERYYYTHPKEIQEELKNAVSVLRVAAVYAQRVDWYLAGDDGEESFSKRLKEELQKIKTKQKHERII